MIAGYFSLQVAMEFDFIMAGIEIGRIEISKRTILQAVQIGKSGTESDLDAFDGTEKKCTEFAIKFVEFKNLFKSGLSLVIAIRLFERKKVCREAVVVYGRENFRG